MLTGSRLCNDTGLAHFFCHQDLADGVIDLVGSCMVKVFTLQIELAPIAFTHSTGIIQWRGSAHIVFQQGIVFLLKVLTLDNREICLLKVMHTLIKNLWYIGSTIASEEASFVYMIFLFLKAKTLEKIQGDIILILGERSNGKSFAVKVF